MNPQEFNNDPKKTKSNTQKVKTEESAAAIGFKKAAP